tara:strand:+ start:3416 stop:4309 length:894 start_codon:yes stop_codon:yes gene_type:complete
MAETQTVENITRLAPFMEDYTRKLLESAYQRVQTPQDVPNIQVAELTPEQIKAGQLANQGVGTYQPFLDEGKSLTQAGIALAADPTGYQQFLSPYTQDVIDNLQTDIDRNRQIQGQGIAGNAVAQGAFGGSRERIAQTELAGAAGRQFADASAKLREAGYQSALNQQQRVAQGLGQFGGQMANLGAQQQQLGQQDISNLLGIGSLYQQQAQGVADAERATALQQSYEPYQRLGFLSDILRGVPTTQSSMSIGTSPSQNPLSQIAGIAATGLGLAGQLGYRPAMFGGQGINFGGGGTP